MKRHNFYLSEPRAAEHITTVSEQKPAVEVVDNHIYFYCEITPEKVLELVKKLREVDAYLRYEQIARDTPYGEIPIWLHIQSDGGDVFPAFSAADDIGRIQTPVYSIVEGYCASAATVISLACAHRLILPKAFMLIHQFSGGMWGKYEEMKDQIAFNDMIMERLVKFYANRTGMKKKKVRKLLQRDSWFNAKQCVKLGLADEVLK